MDLWTPVVPQDKWHHNYATMMKRDHYSRDVLSDWATGFVDRDGKFVQQFQLTFNACFLELYVHAVLKHYGFRVDFQHASPDFVLPDQGFNIEVTVASNAQGAQEEHMRNNVQPPADLNVFNRAVMLRLSNSIVAKHRHYLSHYSKLAHVAGKPFVLAITNFDQPFSFMACQRPIEAVLYDYYVDEQAHIDAGGGPRDIPAKSLRQIFKENGTPIELGMFATPAFKEISAVIFNNCATMGKARALSADPNPNIVFGAVRNMSDRPAYRIAATKADYKESLIDGLRVYHNVHATYPLSPDLFRHPEVFQWFYRNGEARVENIDHNLMFRTVMTGMDRQPA